jgi:membrane-associated phospholipid phosphatase
MGGVASVEGFGHLGMEVWGAALLRMKLEKWVESQDWTMYGMVFSVFLIWRIGAIGGWSKGCWILLAVCLVGVRKDQSDIEWTRFFAFGIPLLGVFYYFYGAGNAVWWELANWMFQNNKHPLHWDELMQAIPLNTGAWARTFSSEALDEFMVWVYSYSFVVSLWICIVRSFWTKSVKKMLSYALSGHLLQFPLILPFYNLILLREVWYVNNQPDLLQRQFTDENALLVNVMNCFPSMHTSIAFAMLLLARRETDGVFKTTMVAYCVSIIFSTMYLQIHWVVDVLAGMAFGFGAVKLADGLIHVVSARLVPARLKAIYEGKPVEHKTDGGPVKGGGLVKRGGGGTRTQPTRAGRRAGGEAVQSPGAHAGPGGACV